MGHHFCPVCGSEAPVQSSAPTAPWTRPPSRVSNAVGPGLVASL